MREVCEGGCFLLHPDDEREGRHAIERAKLIPQLILNLDALTGDLRKTQAQRDKAREATKKATELWRIEVNRTVVLESKLADSFDLWDVILGGGIGAGAGAVILLILLVAL